MKKRNIREIYYNDEQLPKEPITVYTFDKNETEKVKEVKPKAVKKTTKKKEAK